MAFDRQIEGKNGENTCPQSMVNYFFAVCDCVLKKILQIWEQWKKSIQFMTENKNCLIQTCSDDCCNQHGFCPSDYPESVFTSDWTECYYYYGDDDDDDDDANNNNQNINDAIQNAHNAAVGVIVGSVVGGVLLLAIIIGLIVWCCCYRKPAQPIPPNSASNPVPQVSSSTVIT